MQKTKLCLFIIIALLNNIQLNAQWNSPAGNIVTDLDNPIDRVGIGVNDANVSDKLHVVSAVGQNAFRVQVGDATKLRVFSNGAVSVGSNLNNPNTIPNGLFVLGLTGIGENTPTDKLHVVSAVNQFPFRVQIGTVTKLRVHTNGGVVVGNNGVPPTDGLRINGHTVPHVSCAFDLGSPALAWRDLYICDDIVNTSDARLKENVQNLSYGLKDILKLRPVTFTWINNPYGQKKLGLIAQEVQNVIPEMVSDSRIITDEATGASSKVPNETLGLKYFELIPVLIKAIQEQQTSIEKMRKEQQNALEAKDKQLDEMQIQIDQLKTLMINKGLPSGNEISSGNASKAVLHPSTPNPFNQATTLRYFIPNDARNATLQIVAANGTIVKTFSGLQKGSGQLVINGHELSTGTYTYSLIVDGRRIDSKKMVLIKQ